MDGSKTQSYLPGRSVTLIGVSVNAILIAFKFFAGIFGHSQALIADAVHSISDLFTDAVVLLGLRIGRKAPDAGHPFGHARIETLASAFVGAALIATALYLGGQASINIYRHHDYHPTGLALIGAGLSIALKEALYHYTVYIGRRIKSQLIVANAWHHRSDALSSVAVFVGVAGAILKPSWNILDSLAAIMVSIFIIKVAVDILRNTLREFTDTAPNPEIVKDITDCALGVEGVHDVHDLRVRTSGGLYQMETHILVDGQLTVTEGHRISQAVERRLAKDIEELDRIIVHVEPAIQGKNDE